MHLLLVIVFACRNDLAPDQPEGEKAGQEKVSPVSSITGAPGFLQLPLNDIRTSNAACLDVRWGTGAIDVNAMFLSAPSAGTIWYSDDGKLVFEYYGGENRVFWDGQNLWENSTRWEGPVSSNSKKLAAIPSALQLISTGFPGGIWTVEAPPFPGHQGANEQWAKLMVPGITETHYIGVKNGQVFSVIAVEGSWYGILVVSYSDWDYSPTPEQLSAVPSGERWANCTIQTHLVEEM